MEPLLLKPNKKGTILGLATGVVFIGIAAVMLATGNLAGGVVALIGGVALYAGVGGLVPGQGLYLDANGFRLRSFGKSFGASWVETVGFTPTTVQVGRRGGDVAVVRIEYQPGLADRRIPRHQLGQLLGVDERYLVAAYGNLSNTQLAELLERYRKSG